MKDRLKEIRKNHPNGKTQDTFAEYLGVAKQNISSYEVGRRKPSDAFIHLICEKCNVNENWLRTGQGDMFVEQSRNEQMAKLTKQLLHEEEDSFKNRLISVLANLTDEQWEVLADISENLTNEKADV